MMFNSVSTFIDTVFQPIIDFSVRCLSVQIFGFPLYSILLTLFLLSIVGGLIRRSAKGSSGLGDPSSSRAVSKNSVDVDKWSVL